MGSGECRYRTVDIGCSAVLQICVINDSLKREWEPVRLLSIIRCSGGGATVSTAMALRHTLVGNKEINILSPLFLSPHTLPQQERREG